MGHSVTIIACGLDDFPALAEATAFRRSGAPPELGLPPIGYSEANGHALVWIDRIAGEDTAPPDLATMSRIVPFWALTVVESETYAILERYVDGEVTCAIWSSPGLFSRLRSYGDCPFDLAELERQNLVYTRENQDRFGIEQEPSPFTIPILAFRELTGVEYDGAELHAVEPATASFPVES